MLESIRPLLLLPKGKRTNTIGRNVLLAWNGSNEASRAITDAIPILRKAETVTLITINEQNGDIPNLDMTSFLERHGVKVDTTKAVKVKKGDQNIGEALLEQASQLGCDLIVIGAYGHSRLREYLLGGVTNHLLKNSELPVLMAH